MAEPVVVRPCPAVLGSVKTGTGNCAAAHSKRVRRRMAFLRCIWPVFSRNGGVRTRLEGGFAVARERVYCFLSRREGDSEELVTAGGQTPKIKTNSGRAFERS